MSEMIKNMRRLLPLAFYSLLAFITLYAIIFHNGTHTAGYDFFNYNWNFWWIRHALATPGLNVYLNDFVMFPALSSYGYHALTAFWFPLWALLEPFVGTLTAINIIIFVGSILNGYLLFILLRSEDIHPALALIAGATLQVFPIARYFYYNTHLNLMDWFWLPAHLLMWKQIVVSVTARKLSRAVIWGIVMAVGLWGLLLTDLQFPIFVAFVLIPYGLWTLWRAREDLFSLIGIGLFVVSIALVLMWFAGPLPYISSFAARLTPSPVEERPGIPFPSGFFTMSDQWWEWHSPSTGAFITFAFLSAIVVNLIPAVRRRLPSDRWLWFIIALPPLILSLGPTLQIGDVAIPLPFRWMYALTTGNFRMPWRLAPVFVVAASLFICKTWSPLFSSKMSIFPLLFSWERGQRGRVKSFLFAVIFFLLTLSVRLYEPGPLQPILYPYQFYEQMGEEPYEYVVVEVPTGMGTGEVLLGDVHSIQFQYYGMTHRQRMTNGFISRTPLENFYYIVTDDPMLSWLGQRRLLDSALVEAQLRERIFDYPIGYIVIHMDYIGRNRSTLQEIIGYLNTLPDLLCPYTVEAEAFVYRTVWHPDGCPPRIPPQSEPGVYTIDVGSPGDEFFIGWGWHWQEQVSGLTLRWTGEYAQTQTYFDLPPGAYELTLTAQAFWEPRQLMVLLDAVPLGEPVSVAVEGLQTLRFTIPATLIDDGQHLTLTLAYDATIIPAEVGQSADPRRLAIAIETIAFRSTP